MPSTIVQHVMPINSKKALACLIEGMVFYGQPYQGSFNGVHVASGAIGAKEYTFRYTRIADGWVDMMVDGLVTKVKVVDGLVNGHIVMWPVATTDSERATPPASTITNGNLIWTHTGSGPAEEANGYRVISATTLEEVKFIEFNPVRSLRYAGDKIIVPDRLTIGDAGVISLDSSLSAPFYRSEFVKALAAFINASTGTVNYKIYVGLFRPRLFGVALGQPSTFVRDITGDLADFPAPCNYGGYAVQTPEWMHEQNKISANGLTFNSRITYLKSKVPATFTHNDVGSSDSGGGYYAYVVEPKGDPVALLAPMAAGDNKAKFSDHETVVGRHGSALPRYALIDNEIIRIVKEESSISYYCNTDRGCGGSGAAAHAFLSNVYLCDVHVLQYGVCSPRFDMAKSSLGVPLSSWPVPIGIKMELGPNSASTVPPALATPVPPDPGYTCLQARELTNGAFPDSGISHIIEPAHPEHWWMYTVPAPYNRATVHLLSTTNSPLAAVHVGYTCPTLRTTVGNLTTTSGVSSEITVMVSTNTEVRVRVHGDLTGGVTHTYKIKVTGSVV